MIAAGGGCPCGDSLKRRQESLLFGVANALLARKRFHNSVFSVAKRVAANPQGAAEVSGFSFLPSILFSENLSLHNHSQEET
jgi:hypothetical protein